MTASNALENAPAPVMSPFAADIMARQPFANHRLLECLASDDRRAVFKTEEDLLGRTTALKTMRPWPGRAGTSEDFFSLAGSIARLRCRGAARGMDAGRGGGVFFLAYDFIPGENLAKRLARRQTGRLSEREALRLVRELARRLQELFELGHSHGNLKPSNVMLLPEGGNACLLDLGFAWTLAWPDDASAFRAAPDFLPPERIAGDLDIDIRGDLYSLGAIWHQALLGEPVFKGAVPEETLRLHLEQPPTPPREKDPRLSAATSGLIVRLLEKDRDARPRTPAEFLRRLAEHPLFAETENPVGPMATPVEEIVSQP